MSQEVFSYNGGGKMYGGMTLEEARAKQLETLGEARYTEDEDAECEDSEEETSDDMEDAPKPSWIRHRAIRAGIPCKLWRCRFECLCSVPRKVKTGPHKWSAEPRLWMR